MIWKTRNCRGKGSGHPWVPLLLFAIWWEITFCSTLAKQNSDGGRPPKPNRGCKFRASIEHKLTRGLSQKTVCVYAIRSALSGLSSQFCYNVTKCWSGCRKTNISLVGRLKPLHGSTNWTFSELLWVCILCTLKSGAKFTICSRCGAVDVVPGSPARFSLYYIVNSL